ncbi:hypothetical protein ACOSQ2_007844 [Xanthoceras sorbifolium]
MVTSPVRSVVHRVRWQPPISGLYKLNIDASLDSSLQLVGFGIIIRNHVGEVMGCSWQRFALDIGVVLSAANSDASSLVELVNGSAPSFADIGLVVFDIKQLLFFFPSCLVSFVPRLANIAAHGLARFALSSLEDGFLIDCFPPYVESCIRANLPG